ncbi:MAG: Vitamin B12-binding protein [Phycisphaerae bacterium]|nr:Vitamin B12-binding protein [Phycisphaerae bacterium]
MSVTVLGVFAIALAAVAAGVVATSVRRVKVIAASGGDAGTARVAAAGQYRRIISLSPALTTMLFDIGAGDRVVAVSRFSPPRIDRPRVGDAQSLSVEDILRLKPDVILIQQKPTPRLELLAGEYRIPWMDLRTTRLVQIKLTLLRLGDMTDAPRTAEVLGGIEADLLRVGQRVADLGRPRVLLAVNTEVRAAGPGTFVSDLVEAAGGVNVVQIGEGTYPILNKEMILNLRPDVIIDVASDLGDQDADSPAMQRRREFWKTLSGCPAVDRGQVHVVQDGSITIPGSHVGRTAWTLARLIHPEAFAGEDATQ